ncbi:MAG: hypothetical protein ACREBG_01605, partial [Pyrinomonadaceae bacterium]
STDEGCEQTDAFGQSGAAGGKAAGQGKCGRVQHVPDSVPDTTASGTNLHTIGVQASRHDLRQEPDGLVAHVRICGGGGQQWSSLLRPSGGKAEAAGKIE